MAINWELYAPYFSPEEFRCKHTGKSMMNVYFLDLLLKTRIKYDKPMIVTSGFRHRTHPVEVNKNHRGEHTFGMAGDFGVAGVDAIDLICAARSCGFNRIGLKQKGSARFVHLGAGDYFLDFPPALWTY